MADEQTVDIVQIIDRQKIGGFHIALIILSFLTMLIDGYDIGAAAFAAPALIKDWHVSREGLGFMFSAGLFAGLFGPSLFGYIGDRFGRKNAIVFGLVFFGLFTTASVWATDVRTLGYLRFVAGLGISGVLPAVVAINTEFAPRRLQARLVILMFAGITFGGGLPGIVAAKYMATEGWQILFWIGGLFPIALAVLLAVALPESIKFLCLREDRKPDLVRLLKRIEPGLNVNERMRFIISTEQNRAKFQPSALFVGKLKFITPLFWISTACSLMVFYFINQWMPTLLSGAGISLTHAVLAITVFQFAGTLGGLVIMYPLDKWGFLPVPILFALGIPIVFFIGTPHLPDWGVMVLLAGAGFTVLGLNFGNIAMIGPVYPTYVRSWGVGANFGAGRVGGVLGPVVGGVLLSFHLSLQEIFYVACVPLVLGLVVTLILTPIYLREVHNTKQIGGASMTPIPVAGH